MCLLRIYRASVGRYTTCGYCQERTSSHWRDDAKPFSRVASFQGTPVHKDSAVTAPTAQSANPIYAIADSFLTNESDRMGFILSGVTRTRSKKPTAKS